MEGDPCLRARVKGAGQSVSSKVEAGGGARREQDLRESIVSQGPCGSVMSWIRRIKGLSFQEPPFIAYRPLHL